MSQQLNSTDGINFGLIILNERPLPAHELVTMLSALSKAFDLFLRRKMKHRVRGTLAIGSVRKGSIEIIFDAVDGLIKLQAARDYLAPFATHLGQLISAYASHPKMPDATKTELSAVNSIVSPVANGNARQVNVVAGGNVSVIVDPETAKTVLRHMQAGNNVPVSRTARTVQSEAPPLLTQADREALTAGGLEGTAFNVHGTWFAKLIDGQGVLVPVHGTTGALLDGATYRFAGNTVHGPRGEIVGITLTQATHRNG